MAEPTKKAPELEQAFNEIFGFDRRESIREDRCVPAPYGCGQPATEFRDALSQREYRISGLCQKCQDEIFGVES